MADPRFYKNRGPFSLADICASAGVELPAAADGAALIHDVAALDCASSAHLAFCSGSAAAGDLSRTRAGFCFVAAGRQTVASQAHLLPCRSPVDAFSIAVRKFYPSGDLDCWEQDEPIHSIAKVADSARLGPGVVIGAGAEIGEGTRIGPNAVIGRGVVIGRDCEIGSNVTISYAYLGDGVLVLPGAQIGQPGFGFSSGPDGHRKIPQIGRVIVQDRVEIGSCTTIDRGALGDTVIGEGTKIDNLVQIGHNTHLGRHCIVVGAVGISGSCQIGDFVVLGGQVGLGDHARIGDGARLGARAGVPPGGYLPGGRDYGGMPAKPIREWAREVAAVAMLAKRRKREGND